MAATIKIPFLDQGITEVLLAEWHKQDGEEVVAGEDLLSIVTDKSNVVLEAEDGGVLRVITSAASTVPPGAIVGMLLASGESGDELLPEIAQHNRALIEQVTSAAGR